MTSHIKLYGPKGDRFAEIKSELSDEYGYEMSNPEVVGCLMSAYLRANAASAPSPVLSNSRSD